MRAAGRGRLRDEGRGLRPARRDGLRGGGRVKLTAENTAIVLDSTADFPEAPERFPNLRVVPLYVRFGDESFRDYVDITPDEFYARLAPAPEPPTTSQPTPGDFLGGLRGARSHVRADPLAADLLDALGHVRERARRRPRTRRRPGARDRHRARSRPRSRCSRSASSAGSSAARPTRRSTRSSSATGDEHELLFTVDTLEYLREGRAHRPRRRARGQPAAT